jgi:pyruvate dehydrogenase E2 component (dihydrolipoamide acetyltransferase)
MFQMTVAGDSLGALRANLLAAVSALGDAAVETATPAGGKKRAAPAAAAPAAAPAPAPVAAAPAAAPAVAGISQADVRKKLQEVVTKLGSPKCSEICLQYGGAPNLGAIPADKYQAVVNAADAALAAGVDPTA